MAKAPGGADLDSAPQGGFPLFFFLSLALAQDHALSVFSECLIHRPQWLKYIGKLKYS